MDAFHCQGQMNERRLHNLKWVVDKKCLTSNFSRSDRNLSNEENQPTNEITKEVYHSFDTAESLSRRISSLSHSKNPDFNKNCDFFTARHLSPLWVTRTQSTPPTCPFSETHLQLVPTLSYKNTVYALNLSLFWVTKRQITPPTYPFSESQVHSPHFQFVPVLSHEKTTHTPYLSVYWVTRTQPTPSICPYS